MLINNISLAVNATLMPHSYDTLRTSLPFPSSGGTQCGRRSSGDAGSVNASLTSHALAG
jgi:hypothetical protein